MNNTLTCFNQIYNVILIFLDTANNQGFCSTIHELLAYFNLTSKIAIPIPTLIISFAYIMNYYYYYFFIENAYVMNQSIKVYALSPFHLSIVFFN